MLPFKGKYIKNKKRIIATKLDLLWHEVNILCINNGFGQISSRHTWETIEKLLILRKKLHKKAGFIRLLQTEEGKKI